MEAPTLLSVVELGGYPNLTPLYQRFGYTVVTVQAGRKAVAAAREASLRVVIAEFNLQRDFRDRTSSLESLMAVLQRRRDVRVLVFFDASEQGALDQLRARFPAFDTLPRPITEEAVEAWLQSQS